MDEPDIAPDGTMMLEPRELYDAAYLGYVHQGGITIAVYSMARTIELIYEANLEDIRTRTVWQVSETQTLEELAYSDAVEHYHFNVSGSIGVGFPVFQVEPWPLETERLARAIVSRHGDEHDWMIEFEWHRDEDDLHKARRAAVIYARRYVEED